MIAPKRKTHRINRHHRAKEGSLSLLETIIALALISTLVLEVSNVQGNAIYFADYGRRITKASWLASRVMAQVEYFHKKYPFKEIRASEEGVPFENEDDYTYDVEVKEWKLPLINLLMGGGLNGGGEEEAEPNPQGELMKGALSKVLGDDPLLMTAQVKVCWPEGATRSCSELAYLLTNQKKFDETIATLEPVYTKLLKDERGKGKKKKRKRNSTTPTTPTPTAPGGGTP